MIRHCHAEEWTLKRFYFLLILVHIKYLVIIYNLVNNINIKHFS